MCRKTWVWCQIYGVVLPDQKWYAGTGCSVSMTGLNNYNSLKINCHFPGLGYSLGKEAGVGVVVGWGWGMGGGNDCDQSEETRVNNKNSSNKPYLSQQETIH